MRISYKELCRQKDIEIRNLQASLSSANIELRNYKSRISMEELQNIEEIIESKVAEKVSSIQEEWYQSFKNMFGVHLKRFIHEEILPDIEIETDVEYGYYGEGPFYNTYIKGYGK